MYRSHYIPNNTFPLISLKKEVNTDFNVRSIAKINQSIQPILLVMNRKLCYNQQFVISIRNKSIHLRGVNIIYIRGNEYNDLHILKQRLLLIAEILPLFENDFKKHLDTSTLKLLIPTLDDILPEISALFKKIF